MHIENGGVPFYIIYLMFHIKTYKVMTREEFLSKAIVESGKRSTYLKVFKVMETCGAVTRCVGMHLSESDANTDMRVMSELYTERVYFVIFDLVF